ncbi:MAG: hypothetical protein PF542_05515 [Nanoarchaeota archaeon]|jgi:hypothetical protein|nr:hypothetical protein [Nanoarchaeota archaeon]
MRSKNHLVNLGYNHIHRVTKGMKFYIVPDSDGIVSVDFLELFGAGYDSIEDLLGEEVPVSIIATKDLKRFLDSVGQVLPSSGAFHKKIESIEQGWNGRACVSGLFLADTKVLGTFLQEDLHEMLVVEMKDGVSFEHILQNGEFFFSPA